MLQAANSIFSSNWGNQNYCQILMITDCGIGLGQSSLKNIINGMTTSSSVEKVQPLPLPFVHSKVSVLCLGNITDDNGFKYGANLYQQLLDISKQNGQLFIPKLQEKSSMERGVQKMFKYMCEVNYKPFEGILNCGSYFKLESPIYLWPEPMPYVSKDIFGNETVRRISRKLEVCGYIKISDISGSGGSPASLSRNLILPRIETSAKKASELEKLETELKNFYAKNTQTEEETRDENSSPSTSSLVIDTSTRESVCLLLHGALKLENMAALVLLADDWYGFAYSYADKKKSNLLLSILPPGTNCVPWLGDLRCLGLHDDALPGESYGFPVKTEKRSYSQNIIVWIRESGLQSDIQKILRHAKKLPEKTQHFYKDLNRIRRNALSLGFNELLVALSDIFEKEIQVLGNSNPECAIQLAHAAHELRRGDRDLKTLIVAQEKTMRL